MTYDVPTLHGDGLLLRPWRDGDEAAVLALVDPVSVTWSASMRDLRTVDDARAWLAVRRDPAHLNWAVTDDASGEVVGRVGLRRIDEQDRSAEIGYAVAAPHRRRGVALRAVTAATTYAFEGLGLARVVLLHATGNLASCAVATASGFAFEGVERQAFDHGDGLRHDAHRHARLATDPAGRAAPAPPAAAPIEPVEIAAGRLQLRPPTVEDAEDALLILADHDVARWNPGPPVLDLAEARAWCARGGDWSDGSHATFSVLDATGGRLLGNVSLHGIDPVQRAAQVGYRVAPWARGQGVATDAVAAISRWAFGRLDLVRIELAHAVANPGSCRVAEKAGYRLEGTLRQSFVYDGRRHDEHLHARLTSD